MDHWQPDPAAMSLPGFFLILTAAFTAAASNIILRIGLVKAGGFLPHEDGLRGMVVRTASEPAVLVGLFLYACAAFVWFRVMSTEKLVQSYVMLTAVTFISVGVGGYAVFDEPMPLQKLTGMIVIIFGMFLVFRS